MLKIEVNGPEIKQRRERLKRGSTQKEFSHAVGISERRLREIENSRTLVPHDLLERIAKALSMQPSLLQTRKSSAAVEAMPLDEEFISPRHNTDIAYVVKTEVQLYDLASGHQVVLCHSTIGLNAETSAYVDELFSTLQALTWGEGRGNIPSGSVQALSTLRRIRELLVLLKGNDVWVYQTTNFKQLPERDVIPDIPDPFDAESQLIIAMGPPGEYGETSIHVPIDNGQPRICRPFADLALGPP